MREFLIVFLEAILIVIALSLDTFVSAFAYGSNRIRISFASATTINLICSFTLIIAIFIGSLVNPYLSEWLTNFFCFIILFLLGIGKLFSSVIKSLIRKKANIDKKVNFSLFNLKFVLSIYADPLVADSDKSHTLSIFEAITLAIALSFDSVGAGIGAGIGNANIVFITIASLILGYLSIVGGSFLGNKITEKVNFDLSWLSGAILVALAVVRI